MKNSREAIGILEVRGIAASLEAADSMAKTADIRMLGTQKIGNALIYIAVSGDVSSVKEAIAAGQETAAEVGEVYASTVIPRAGEEVWQIIDIISGNTGEKKCEHTFDERKDPAAESVVKAEKAAEKKKMKK